MEKNDTGTSLELLCAKNGFKKQLIFEKWQGFENRQNWPLWKGYRLCKRVSLGSKNKILKKKRKTTLRTSLELLCLQKTASKKKHLIFEKWQVFENRQNWPLCKGYRLCKRVTLAQKIKFKRACQKRHWDLIRVTLCKKRLQKTAKIRKMTSFWKWPKLATMQRL